MAEPGTRPFTVPQLAERWQCSTESIYALIRKHERGEPGGLKHFTIGPKLIRIPYPAVDGKTLADFHVSNFEKPPPSQPAEDVGVTALIDAINGTSCEAATNL